MTGTTPAARPAEIRDAAMETRGEGVEADAPFGIVDGDDAGADETRNLFAEAGTAGAADERQIVDEALADELSPGTKLLRGQYQIKEFLNSGGFGITYLARDSLERTVVIKECFPSALCRRSSRTFVRVRSRSHLSEFRTVVKLFLQEARSLAKLDHPNIVGVHQVFEDNDTAYMAIDFVDGRDLLEMIEDDAVRFTPEQIVSYLSQILGAVRYLHELGLLHRDIAPDNILIGGDGKPVLIDFGAAREQASRASRSLSELHIVKDGYSPQEFYVSGSLQTPASDLYALAATFYHLITGEAPPNSQKRLAGFVEGGDPYVPLAGRFAGYPPGFLEAIDKAASVLPKDRIASAEGWLSQYDPAARRMIETERADLDAEIDSAVSRLLSTTGPIAPAPAPEPARPAPPAPAPEPVAAAPPPPQPVPEGAPAGGGPVRARELAADEDQSDFEEQPDFEKEARFDEEAEFDEPSGFDEQSEYAEAAVDFTSPGHFSLPEMAALGRPVARPEFSAISARFAAVAFLALLVGVSVLDLG